MHLYFDLYINTRTYFSFFFFFKIYTCVYIFTHIREPIFFLIYTCVYILTYISIWGPIFFFINLYTCLYFNSFITDIIFCIICTHVYILIDISIHRFFFFNNFYVIATCFRKKNATRSPVHMHGNLARAFDIFCNLYRKRCS